MHNEFARVSRPGSILAKILLFLIFFAISNVFASELQVDENKWFFIPVNLPEGKKSGGDFYSFKASFDTKDVKHRSKNSGIEIKFSITGTHKITIDIYHITKSSCAGASAKKIESINYTVNIKDKENK